MLHDNKVSDIQTAEVSAVSHSLGQHDPSMRYTHAGHIWGADVIRLGHYTRPTTGATEIIGGRNLSIGKKRDALKVKKREKERTSTSACEGKSWGASQTIMKSGKRLQSTHCEQRRTDEAPERNHSPGPGLGSLRRPPGAAGHGSRAQRTRRPRCGRF